MTSLAEWDEHFIHRAHLNAEMSYCVRRHVGAVAVRDRRSFADGFNGNLPGALHCNEGGCDRCADVSRPSGVDLHECRCVHAEENVLTWCAKTGTPLYGATIYSTHRPCVICYRLLVLAGVVRIVFDHDYPGDLLHVKGTTLEQYQYSVKTL